MTAQNVTPQTFPDVPWEAESPSVGGTASALRVGGGGRAGVALMLLSLQCFLLRACGQGHQASQRRFEGTGWALGRSARRRDVRWV